MCVGVVDSWCDLWLREYEVVFRVIVVQVVGGGRGAGGDVVGVKWGCGIGCVVRGKWGLRGGGVVYQDRDGGVVYRGDVYGGGDIVNVAMDVDVVCWRLSME